MRKRKRKRKREREREREWERERERERGESHTGGRIKEIADRIEDARRLHNGGEVGNAFKRNLERDVIQCFIRGLRPELEIRVEEKDTFREFINDSIDIGQILASNSTLRRNKNMEYSKNTYG